MAIATDAFIDGGSVTGTLLEYSHTCTGSDRILFVLAYRIEAAITGATYAGVAMTEIATVTDTVSGYVAHMFVLVAPATGANNVRISTGTSSLIVGVSGSYTGAKQSGQPDNFTTNNDATSTSTFCTSLTPVADNCWIVMLKQGDQLVTGTSGCTERVVNAIGRLSLLDTDGPISPAALTTLCFSTTFAGTQHTTILASFDPASNPPPTPGPIVFNMQIG